ncbi:MAG: RagB/SusD family nutrient uptake outer membrane protein, partial [Candidatus Cryptobacteroides sp.]
MKKHIIKSIAMLFTCVLFVQSCFNLDEQVFDRVDADIYYSDETSVQGAVASIYYKAVFSYMEYFWYLQEFSADQIAWRTWNGGLWGWDEGLKFVLSSQTWNSESTIIRQAWETAWTTIGLCNNVIYDLRNVKPEDLGMTQEKVDAYIAE